MNELRKAAEMALEALESDPDDMIEVTKDHWEYKREQAWKILRAALAQPEPEPVRKPLTGEEIAIAANSIRWSEQYHVDFARAIERVHGIE